MRLQDTKRHVRPSELQALLRHTEGMLVRLLLLSSAFVCAQLVAAAPVAAEGVWLPGPDGVGSATYTGSIDRANGPQVSGWVVDTTAQGWTGIDDVQLWDGLMSAGGRLVSHAVIQGNRPDVAATLIRMGYAMDGVLTALDVDDGLAVLAEARDAARSAQKKNSA